MLFSPYEPFLGVLLPWQPCPTAGLSVNSIPWLHHSHIYNCNPQCSLWFRLFYLQFQRRKWACIEVYQTGSSQENTTLGISNRGTLNSEIVYAGDGKAGRVLMGNWRNPRISKTRKHPFSPHRVGGQQEGNPELGHPVRITSGVCQEETEATKICSNSWS